MPQASVGTTGLQITGKNSARKSIVFLHAGTANNIYIDIIPVGSISSSNAGIRLRANDAIVITAQDDGISTVISAWSAIADAGTNTLIYFEGVE